MTPTIASIAITVALLTGDGIVSAESTASAGSAAVGIVPAVDVPAPLDWGVGDGVRLGGQATRIEFDNPALNAELSVWYRLAYLEGGTRLQVFEHSAAGVYGPDSVIMRSENTAWTIANEAVGSNGDATVVPDLPSWAHVRTGITTGPSAGLIFTLAYIDLLTNGALVGSRQNLATPSANGSTSPGTSTQVEPRPAIQETLPSSSSTTTARPWRGCADVRGSLRHAPWSTGWRGSPSPSPGPEPRRAASTTVYHGVTSGP